MKKYIVAFFLLLVGIVGTILFSAALGSSGGGEVSSGIFNSAMSALIFSIIFLSATILFSTLLLIEELRKGKR
ncbi:hypothetical protein ACFSCX_15515 [Bacillus salitolerans]|uniref:DUF3955 domain-containing protein n=1 Tax=Bacillus salitolerans TaxID=1437434 RepID=A0ABW4LS04_9BACI